MSEELLKALHEVRGNPSATASICDSVARLGLNRLPSDYFDFLKIMNGGEGKIGPRAYVIFWKGEELKELNEAYQVNEYAPGLLLFGSDGGGDAYGFDLRHNIAPIIKVPFVGMELPSVELLATSFQDFILLLETTHE